MKVIEVEKVKTLFKLLQFGMSEETKKSMDEDIAYLLEERSIEIDEKYLKKS